MRGFLPGDSIEKTVPESGVSAINTDGKSAGAGRESGAVFRDHTVNCPICGKAFTSEVIKSGSMIVEDYDLDLRPRFKKTDITLYKVIQCPHCGYSGHERIFGDISNGEAGLIKDRMIPQDERSVIRFADRIYENTYPIYRSALSFAMIGGIKAGKRAYTALYTAWLLRGWREERQRNGEIIENGCIMGSDREKRLLRFATENFRVAGRTESYPICGMEMPVFHYLLAALLYLDGEYEDAKKFLDSSKRAGDVPAFVKGRMYDLTGLLRRKLG